MVSPVEQQLIGLDYLAAVTALLQRVRSEHPTAGLYEAADFQWWWRAPRPTDAFGQLVWFDDDGRPEAAATVTGWADRVALDPIFLSGATEALVAHVVDRGLAHASVQGIDTVSLEADPADAVLREVLVNRGFEIAEPGLVETWLASDAKPAVSPLAAGYQLSSRLDTTDRPHHMTHAERNHPDSEERLRQTSLYRADLDLVVHDARGDVAAYGLFWFDPTTATGLVEPMRTEDDHQRRGLARHVLTSGVDRLAAAGAERIKICYEPDNPASSHLYVSVGFSPDRQTVVYSGRTS